MEKLYFIHDCKGPEALQVLAKYSSGINETQTSSLDYLALLVHGLMIETGFVDQEEDKNLVCDHRVKYILGGMNNSVMHCTVSLNKIGNVTTIIGNFHGNPKSSFVMTKTRINDIVKLESTEKYQNVKEFSMEFKNKIALPLLYQSNIHAGIEPMTILSLPLELLVSIAEHLPDVATINAFRETCRKFKDISEHQLLWKRLFARFFPDEYEKRRSLEEPATDDWLKLFKQEYQKKKLKVDSANSSRTVHMPYFGIEPMPLPRHWLHFLEL